MGPEEERGGAAKLGADDDPCPPLPPSPLPLNAFHGPVSSCAGGLSVSNAFRVVVVNTNSQPKMDDVVVTVAENISSYTNLTTLTATDEDSGDSLTFSIIACSVNATGSSCQGRSSMFSIDNRPGWPRSAVLSLGASLIDYEDSTVFGSAPPVYRLTVQVVDDASVPLRSAGPCLSLPRSFFLSLSLSVCLPLPLSFLSVDHSASTPCCPCMCVCVCSSRTRQA